MSPFASFWGGRWQKNIPEAEKFCLCISLQLQCLYQVLRRRNFSVCGKFFFTDPIVKKVFCVTSRPSCPCLLCFHCYEHCYEHARPNSNHTNGSFGVSRVPLYNHMESVALRIITMSLFAYRYLHINTHTYVYNFITIYIYTCAHTYININIASLTSNASRHCNNENLECFFENLWRGHVQYWFCFPIRHRHT